MKIRWFLRVPFFIALAAAAVLAIGFVVMLLWNALIPAVFGGPVVTYWQAVGLLLLSKILFHGFAGGRHRHHRHDHSWKKERLKRKLSSMTPEQQEKFRRRCEHIFGTDSFDDEHPHTAAE